MTFSIAPMAPGEVGRIAILPDATPIAASANPSPLSIAWGLSDYLALLAAPLAQ